LHFVTNTLFGDEETMFAKAGKHTSILNLTEINCMLVKQNKEINMMAIENHYKPLPVKQACT